MTCVRFVAKPPKVIDKLAKPPFAATSHIWIYAAADQADAQKVARFEGDQVIVLDRSEMWDCTPLTGCQSHYEVRNTKGRETHGGNIVMRELPCPCPRFLLSEFNNISKNCEYVDLVGSLKARTLKHKERVAAVDESRNAEVDPESAAEAEVEVVMMPPRARVRPSFGDAGLCYCGCNEEYVANMVRCRQTGCTSKVNTT